MTSITESKCVVCSGESFPIFFVEGATICKCRCCNLEFSTPMPSAAVLEQLYSDYVYYTEYDREMIRNTVRKNSLKNIDYLSRHGLSRDKRLLDFGCGEDLFVKAAGSANWIGYDYPQDDLGRIARQDFEFITLWGVLEHLPDPMSIIGNLATLMKAGGKIIMTTVGTETGIPYRYRYPVHLTWWSSDAIRSLLQQNGFRTLEISNYQMIQNPGFYLDRVLDRGRVPPEIKEKISIDISEDILVPTNEILVVGERL